MKQMVIAAIASALIACLHHLTPMAQASTFTTAQAQVSSYPPATIANFMRGCTAGHPPSMEKNCTCIIQEIQRRYTFPQYQALVKGMQIKNPDIQGIIRQCDIASDPSFSSSPTGNTQFYVQAQDGAFLGIVSNNQVAQNSVCNQVGTYGSQVSLTSIRNQIGTYGSQISDLSAYNPNAQNPPLVIQDGKAVMILTKNRSIQGGTDPDEFFLNICGR